jgi:hypothetical protein
MSALGDDMDLPYEPGPPGYLHDTDARFSGGVVVMASVVDVPEAGPKPALVFRFITPTGGFYPPTVLVCDDDQLAKLRPLILQAVHAAREAAKARRSAS